MLRQKRFLIGALGAITLFLLFAPTGQVVSQRLERVFVTNFPEVQPIVGEVTITEPVHLSALRRFEEITVAPVLPTETTRLIDAGTLVTDGFPSVVLSLHGVVKGHVAKTGSVGAILLPLQGTIQEAFDEHALMHFTLETVATGVSSKTPYFASNQPRYTVGFDAYRVLLYNTTDKTVSVSLFAYLTN